ncbi:MAG: DM13 domain-containing protein [Patescibacteria group bacterium]
MAIKKAKYVVGAFFLIVVLGFAYYTISPLFISIKADEALPSREVEDSDTAPVTILKDEAEVPIAKPLVATVIDTSAHPATGTVRVVEENGKTYVRYENYKTINGPDIFVYLAKDIDAQEFVNLGRVKATEGNINYEVPDGVNVSEYPYVLTWCKQFGVLFNYADFSETR